MIHSNESLVSDVYVVSLSPPANSLRDLGVLVKTIYRFLTFLLYLGQDWMGLLLFAFFLLVLVRTFPF